MFFWRQVSAYFAPGCSVRHSNWPLRLSFFVAPKYLFIRLDECVNYQFLTLDRRCLRPRPDTSAGEDDCEASPSDANLRGVRRVHGTKCSNVRDVRRSTRWVDIGQVTEIMWIGHVIWFKWVGIGRWLELVKSCFEISGLALVTWLCFMLAVTLQRWRRGKRKNTTCLQVRIISLCAVNREHPLTTLLMCSYFARIF